jgi:hypothetical protein
VAAHKDKSRYGSKTERDGIDRALQQTRLYINIPTASQEDLLTFHRITPVNPTKDAEPKKSYNVRPPADVTHTRPINKERSIRQHERTGRGEKRVMNVSVVGDGVRNVYVFVR